MATMDGNPAHSAETLLLAVEAADVGVWFWDLVSDEHQWSDRCKVHLALPPGTKPTTDHFYAALHPDDRERVRDVIRRAHETREDYRAEYRIMEPGGAHRWIAGMGRVYADPDGRPVSMRGVTLDITRLKKAEQDVRELNATLETRIEQRTAALNAERRRLTATLDSLLDPHLLMQPVRDDAGQVVDFTVAYANPAACAWLDVDAEHVRGTRLCATHPAMRTSGLLATFAGTADTGRTTAIDAFAIPRDASDTRWIDLRAVRVEEQVSFTWCDVTQQHEAATRLAASEERFRLLAENSSDVVMRTDGAARILWVSPSITPVLGWSPAEWIGRTVTDVFARAERCGEVLYGPHGALAGNSVVVRTRLPAKDGGNHWVEIHAGPSRTAEAAIDGVVASFRLVDKEIEAERILELRASTDELTALLNRKEAIERIDSLTKRTGRRIAVLSCDIDRFKTVNDTYGHAAGDDVLRAVADRIRGCLRSGDDLGARIGGDELLVILHGVRDLDDALAVAEKLHRRAAEPIQTSAGPITTTLSIGVTLARPAESTDALIARADEAMYKAKNRGRNQVVALEAAGAEPRG
jgi:diguanylate cyclase (GGDEF)-like protein/PAS domain S-box-containing protein